VASAAAARLSLCPRPVGGACGLCRSAAITETQHPQTQERGGASVVTTWVPGRSGPDVARNRQRGEIGVGEGRLRLHAHLIQEPVDLSQVLRRVPGGPLHEIVSALRTVVGVDSALAPPGLRDIVGDAAAHRVAVAATASPSVISAGARSSNTSAER